MMFICLNCGINFERYLSKTNIKRGKGKFCNSKCFGLFKTGKPFLAKIQNIFQNCLYCGKKIKTIKSKIKRGKGKYCNEECYHKAIIGKTPWNKGTKLSKEHREKLSNAQKKRFEIEEPWNKGKESKISGENHCNWQGGKTEKSKKIRNSLKYKLWRKAVFERDNYTCVLCKNTGVYLEVDHIKSFALFPELRFDLNNGRTLCKECHKRTETYGHNHLYRKLQ